MALTLTLLPLPTATGLWLNTTVAIWFRHIGEDGATVALSSTLLSKPFRLDNVTVKVPLVVRGTVSDPAPAAMLKSRSAALPFAPTITSVNSLPALQH